MSARARARHTTGDDRLGADGAVSVLTHALGLDGQDARLEVVSRRLAGRSSIYVIASTVPVDGLDRWVLKQPRLEWRQDDLAAPVTAEQEFSALRRLHAHFERLQPDRAGGSAVPSTGSRLRVPTPVALLPEVGALVMEHVAGRTTRELVNYGSVLHPGTLLTALAAGGRFLKGLHALEAHAPVMVDLRDEARGILAFAEAELQPRGLSLPREATDVLSGFPGTPQERSHVVLHGDFGPGNILLAEDGSTVGLDPALDTVGPPELDLARYVAVLSGSVRFAPELLARPAAGVRRRLVRELLDAYYGDQPVPVAFELQLLGQLARRWCRLRELALQNERPALLSTRLRVIDGQMRWQLREAARRLVA
jgi:hypothetical protein